MKKNAKQIKRQHYFAIKTISAILTEITPKNHGDIYCFNCFHSIRTKNKLESNKKIRGNKDFCKIFLCLLKALKY